MLNYVADEKIYTSANSGNVVLKVRVANKEKPYALKLYAGINESFQKLIFNREMEALKVLNSCEGIVKIRDTSTGIKYKGQRHYGAILMDYVPGKTLDRYDWNKYSQLKKYEICLKILKTVNNAHSNNVIHRDLKPANIIYNDINHEITIIDFGSSKIKTIIEKETTMPMYSENYSAPELVSGNNVTERSDYYSLGVIFSEILFLLSAKDSVSLIDEISKLSYKANLKDIICSMLQNDPSFRPQSILDIMEIFNELIGELNTTAFEYNIVIDSSKLQYLKMNYIIDNSLNMAVFVNSYLKKQFTERYGYYDERYDKYIITGLELVLECTVDESNGMISVMRISDIPVDRRNINIKRSFKIEGKLTFVDSRHKNQVAIGKDNGKLLVMFKNRRNENELFRMKEDKFENLFGKWQEGLDESIVNEKEKVAKIIYSEYEVSENHIILEVDDCKSKSIDEIQSNVSYVIEGTDDRGQSVYFDLGVFDEIICNDDCLRMIFSLPKKILRGNVKALLDKKAPVMESFLANTSSYRRQLKAVHALRTEEYSSRNLKDIILNIEEPEEIPTLTPPIFIAKNLNESQKQAVVKALNSENISLIQGPPGTGKTKVIKELIGQIIRREVQTNDSPKILIVSQSHTAVDNILEGLDKVISNNMQIIRIGSEKNISPEISNKYTISAHREALFSIIETNVKKHIQDKQTMLMGNSNVQEQTRWDKIKSIQEDWIQRSAEKDCIDYQMIRSATVIAGTCIGFLSNGFIKDMEFDYVIIDEAAKATTPELLVSIIKAKKIILVGDQNQLPAYADDSVSPTIAKLTKKPEYRIFDILFDSLPKTHKQILTTQYRMIENIGNLISLVFYGGTIDTGCDKIDKLHGLSRYKDKSIIWFDTSVNKDKGQRKIKGGSYINEEEKRIILEVMDDLNKSGELKGLDVGIITGYSGQKDLLRKAVKSNEYDKIAKIDINTLDAFQGRENDVIIYSTVRTKDSIGFQKEKERVNVAFSRAKKLLIICGDLDFFYYYDDPNNKFIEIIDYIKEHDECLIIPCTGGKLF